MTDKELSKFGEKLYEAILTTPLPGGTIFAIASAIRKGTPWSALPTSLKLAVFKIAANCAPEPRSAEPPQVAPEPSIPGEEPMTVRPAGPSEDPARAGALPEREMPLVEPAAELEPQDDESDETPAPEAA